MQALRLPGFPAADFPLVPLLPILPSHDPATHRLHLLSPDFSLRLSFPPERTLTCCTLLLSPPASSEWPSGCRSGYPDWLTPRSLELLQQILSLSIRKLWVWGKKYLLHSLKKKKTKKTRNKKNKEKERTNLRTIFPHFWDAKAIWPETYPAKCWFFSFSL